MTQKRGLGRGLGALIPGAGSSPAPEQELRTRTRPQDEGGSAASSTRPVDMFFSGEKVSSEDAPQRGGARDLATGMARAAAERRGRTAGRSGSSSTAKRSGAATSSGGADASGSGAGTATEATTTSRGTAAKRGASSSAGTGSRSTASRSTASKGTGTAAKGTTSKSTASKSTTTKNTASKGTSSKGTSATSPPSTTAKSSGAAKSAGTAKSTSSSRTSSPAKSTSGSKGASSPAKGSTGVKRTAGAKSAAAPTAAAESTGPAEGTAASKDASTALQATSAPTAPTPAPATGGAVDETAPIRTDEVPTVASAPAEQEQASSQAAPAAAENEATAPASSAQDAQPETADAPEEAPQAGSAESESEAHARGEDSPVVDVEAVEYTRVPDTAPSKDAEPAAPAEPSTTEQPAVAPPEAPAPESSSAPADEHPAPDEPAETDSESAAAVGPDGDAHYDDGEAPSDVGGQSDAGSERAPLESQGLVSVPGAEFAEIPIHEVRENPRNPRTMFDEEELDELAHSLREVGVLQPVVVRPIPVTEDGESFELVMGERRWRAARRAGLTAIPAIIRETSDDDLLRDALLENLHRTQLNPLEEANAYQQLLDDFGCTQDELGERIGRSRPQITNTLRLLRLPALVQRRLASGAISAGHARALLSLDDPTLMEELAQRIVSEGLSVRAVERLVARGGQQQAPRTVRRSTYDPHVVDLTSRLSNRLEAPVRIDVGKRKGKITLEFTNLEDLERLMENMGLELPASE